MRLSPGGTTTTFFASPGRLCREAGSPAEHDEGHGKLAGTRACGHQLFVPVILRQLLQPTIRFFVVPAFSSPIGAVSHRQAV